MSYKPYSERAFMPHNLPCQLDIETKLSISLELSISQVAIDLSVIFGEIRLSKIPIFLIFYYRTPSKSLFHQNYTTFTKSKISVCKWKG